MGLLKIGHLLKNDESKISSVSVNEGQVIFSEKSGMQFVDYGSKRHTIGSVLSGIYNNSSLLEFSTDKITDCLSVLAVNEIPDGQLVSFKGVVYQYRIIDKYRLLTKINKTSTEVNTGDTGYVIYFPNYNSSDSVTIDLLISINNSTNGDKTFLLRIENDTLVTASCNDIDGDFNLDTCSVVINKGGPMYRIGASEKSIIKIISYSVTINGTTTNDTEGCYVAGIVEMS